jgi:N-formylglutamate amidohydrolase
MAEAKPKGAPVFLEIPATGETITLPGVTSLNNNDELKAAADAWIAKNYKGPTLAAPIVARSPATGGSAVTANRQRAGSMTPLLPALRM